MPDNCNINKLNAAALKRRKQQHGDHEKAVLELVCERAANCHRLSVVVDIVPLAQDQSLQLKKKYIFFFLIKARHARLQLSITKNK